MLLTISQLAAHCGVTVRAVRHYHDRGLLAEPERDTSGYRRYGAQAVVDLIRIKTLADAGVPLSQVRRMLDSSPASFASTVAEIDAGLQHQIGDLQRRREELTKLLAGDRLVLPDVVVELLDLLRATGVSDWTIRTERDGWIVLAAIAPEVVDGWARQKVAALSDAEFREIYVATDQARDWDRDDPRLEELAARMADWAARHRDDVVAADDATIPAGTDVSVVETLLNDELAESPAWRRLGELSHARRAAAEAEASRTPGGGGRSGQSDAG
jgi:DNA-binding transcriptional MerR regulator